MTMRTQARPTKEGLWHPVAPDGTVMWPVEVNIIAVRDPETCEPTRKRIVETYTFGTEERRTLDDWRNHRWVRYVAPRVAKYRAPKGSP